MPEPLPPISTTLPVIEPAPRGVLADSALATRRAVLAGPDVGVLGREFVAGIAVGLQSVRQLVAVRLPMALLRQWAQVRWIDAVLRLTAVVKVVAGRSWAVALLPRPAVGVNLLPARCRENCVAVLNTCCPNPAGTF